MIISLIGQLSNKGTDKNYFTEPNTRSLCSNFIRRLDFDNIFYSFWDINDT